MKTRTVVWMVILVLLAWCYSLRAAIFIPIGKPLEAGYYNVSSSTNLNEGWTRLGIQTNTVPRPIFVPYRASYSQFYMQYERLTGVVSVTNDLTSMGQISTSSGPRSIYMWDAPSEGKFAFKVSFNSSYFVQFAGSSDAPMILDQYNYLIVTITNLPCSLFFERTL
jgi:hypothetical protein